MEIKEADCDHTFLNGSRIVTLSEAGHEALWLRNLYGELRFPQNN